MKKGLFIGLFSFIFLFLLAVAARANSHRNFSLPPQAKPIAPGVFDLGVAVDEGREVRGIAYLHNPKYGEVRGQGGSHQSKPPKCYTYIAKSARWRTTEGYYLDPSNQDGYPAASVSADVANGMKAWDDQVAFTIFGNNLGTTVNGVDTSSPDNKNEIMFGNISDPGTIAVTIVWYTIVNPTIVEHDMMFDDPDYKWGNAGPTNETTLGDTSVMDFWNIAAHELGHSAGMGDIYNSNCSQETEYGYGTNGETKKRTLNTGDITGIKALYI